MKMVNSGNIKNDQNTYIDMKEREIMTKTEK